MKTTTKKDMLIHQLAKLFPKNMDTTNFPEDEMIMIDIVFQLEKLRKTQNEIRTLLINKDCDENNTSTK